VAAKLGTQGYHGDELGHRVDLVVTMGGTGRSCRLPAHAKVGRPILGVNMGTFGYLTVINLNEMFDALEGVLEGNYKDGEAHDAAMSPSATRGARVSSVPC